MLTNNFNTRYNLLVTLIKKSYKDNDFDTANILLEILNDLIIENNNISK